MLLLIFLKKTFKGSKFDRFIRIIINYIAPYYYNSIKKRSINKNNKFIYICYGGLGDNVLSFPFLNNLSKNYNITIFIEKKYDGLQTLLDKNIKIKLYIKKNILKELRKFSKLNQNIVLIQQSPILEFILFNLLLKRPPTIGFLYTQSQIDFSGYNIKSKIIDSDNKIAKYNYLGKIINFSFKKYITNKNDENISKKLLSFLHCSPLIPKSNYFLISPTKDPNWSMGFFDYKVYSNFIENMTNDFLLTPVIVGTDQDRKIIDNILLNVKAKKSLVNLVGKTSILDLISLIKKASFVVANDNGIHHLSNFLNKKTLTLYNFSSYKVFNWPNKNSNYIFKPLYNCMPCVGKENGPFDNYPFKCPWNVRCKNTINEEDIFKKLRELKWIS